MDTFLSGKMAVDQAAQKIYAALRSVGSGKPVRAEKLAYDQTVEIYTTGPTI